MTIKIELTTETLTAPEAGALAAFLLTLHPDAVTAALGSLGEELPGGLKAGDVCVQRVRETEPKDGWRQLEKAGEPYVMPAEAGAPLPDVERFSSFSVETVRKIGMPPEMAAPYSAALTPDQVEALNSIEARISHMEGVEPTPITAEQAFGAVQTITLPTPETTGHTENVATPGHGAAHAVPDLDAEGLPWDERIHSSNHKQSANGAWMKRRGVLPTVDAQVRAELRQTYPAAAPSLTAAQRTMQAAVSEGLIPSPPVSTAVPVPPAPTAVVVPAPPVAAPTTDAPSATPQPTASANTPDSGANTGNTASATTAASPSNGPAEFQRIMQKLAGPTGYQPTGKVTLEQTNGIVAAMGLTGLADLLKNPDRIPEFEAQIDALAGQTGGAA